MKSKIIMLALAATVSLGACVAPQDNRYPDRNYTQDNRDYRYQTTGDYRSDAYVFRSEDLSREDVRKVQRALTREGFYRGKIDGVWGRSTSQAILNYQSVRHPGHRGVSIQTLQEFGVQIERDRARNHYYQPRNTW